MLVTLRPENLGGGRARGTPSARMYKDGQLVLNAACAALLGNTERIVVQVDDKQAIIVITPTTPDNEGGGFRVAGGGNAPIRITLRAAARRFPHLIGEYDQVRRRAGAVELRRGESGQQGQ